MMNKHKSILPHLISTLILSAMAGSAFGYQLRCPASVNVDAAAPLVKTPPTGWEALARSDVLRLEGAFLSTGQPKERAELKGEPFRLDGKQYDWRIAPADLNAPGIWFTCRYSGERVLLTRRIDQPVTACRLRVSKALPLDIALDCQ